MKRYLTLFIVTFLAAAPAAMAAEKASLAQCIAWAVERSPTTQEGNADVAKAKGMLAEVRGHGLLQGELFGMVAPTATAKGSPLNANPGYSSGTLKGVTDWEIGTLQVIQPLYTFGKLDAYGRAATAGIEVAEARRESKRMSTALLITEAYQGYLLADTAVYITDDIDGIVTKAIRQTEAMLEDDSDEVQPTDLMKLKNARGLVLKNKYEAEQGKIIAASALRVLTGHDVVPEESQLGYMEMPAHSLQEWVGIAKSDRPEYREAAQGLIAMQALVEAKRAEAYPDIFMIGLLSAAHSSGRDRIVDPFIRDDFNHFYGTIGIGMRWKFDLALNDAKVAQAQAEKEAVVAKKRYADEMIPLQVEKDYREMMSLRMQTDALNDAARAGRQWLISAASTYDLGVGEAREIFEALAGYATAEGGRLKALHGHNMKAAELLQHVGRLRADMLANKGE